ncbi:MAG: hypothetical protein ABW189_05575 [Rickettsiales bacterium]
MWDAWDLEEHEKHRRLWQKVLLQAVTDAASRVATPGRRAFAA